MLDAAPGHLFGLVAGIASLPAAWALLGYARLLARVGFGPTTRFLNGWKGAPAGTRWAAGAMWAAGFIHLGLISGHGGDPVRQVLFLANGAAFAGLAVLTPVVAWWRRPAILLSLATIAAYCAFVILGLEAVDQVGALSKMVELMVLGLALARPAGAPRRGRLRRGARATLLPATTVLAAVAVWAAALAHPDARHQHAGAVLQAVPVAATEGQKAAAQRLIAQTTAAIAPYRDVKAALAAGYVPQGDPALGTLHFTNQADSARAYVLDPRHPQALVYARTRSGGWLLLGAMYEMPGIGQSGPDVGGPLTQWHVHSGICFSPFGISFSLATPLGTCPLGSIAVTAPAMLHVWTVPNPGGPFAIDIDAAAVARLVGR